MEGFADYVARERERLNTERDSLIQQRRDIDQKLAAIDNEYRAVDAYQAAKAGKNTGRSRLRKDLSSEGNGDLEPRSEERFHSAAGIERSLRIQRRKKDV